MTALTRIAFLYPGSMGSSLAARLHARSPSLRLLTSITGRSEATLARATAAGLVDVPLGDLVDEADIIISILPPSAALDLAKTIRTLLTERPCTSPPIYIDANAVNPSTMVEIATALGPDVPLIDGCVIGAVAKGDWVPRLYLASDENWAPQLKLAADTLAANDGLNVHVMQGAGAGAASALKMAYGGLAKGYIGLGAALILSANAHSPGTARAFLEEMAYSQPDKLWGLCGGLEHMIPNAYRFAGEMEQVSDFITSSLAGNAGETKTGEAGATSTTSSKPDRSPGDIHNGLASLFERIAADLRATGRAVGGAADGAQGDAAEVDALLGWAKDGRQVLQDKGYQARK